MKGYEVIADKLNIRSTPDSSVKDNILQTVVKGTILIAADGWLPVQMQDGTVGLVKAEFVTDAGSVVEIPETPEAPSPDDPMAKAMGYFMSCGWEDFQAAALVGNLMQESNLKPSAVNPSSGATGIAQWLAGRLYTLQQHPDWQTLETQLVFVNWELRNSEKAAGDILRVTTTLEEATLAVRQSYERCGENEANDANRLAQAQKALALAPASAPASTPAQPPWITWALSKVGFQEGQNDAEIDSWFQFTTLAKNLWDCEETAWCAVFANAALFLNGKQGDRSALAADFLNWGIPVSTPKEGDLVIYDHHVNFFLKDLGNGYIECVGGNQGTKGVVSIDQRPTAAVLGYRRPA